jgi:hypothetical protein
MAIKATDSSALALIVRRGSRLVVERERGEAEDGRPFEAVRKVF